MYLGLDIGRQYVKMVAVDKTKDGYKILDAGTRLVPEPNTAYDPEKIDRPHWVMAVKELFRQQSLNPRKIKMVISGINGSNRLKKLVNSKKFNIAFKLCPTNISSVMRIADKKRFMPPKSTWFHPKPLDGLICSEL